REMISALASPDVWDQPPVAAAPREFVVNVMKFAERARSEEEDAKALCSEILTGPSSWWPQRLRLATGAYTAGMVTQLLERVGPIFDTDSPANALQVTSMAIEVANALDVVDYACDYVVKLRANAYRDHAYILSYMGRHLEALEFTERSKRLYDQLPLPEYHLARLALVKASILRSIDRAQEAIALAHDAADTFLRFGDRTRYINARVWEAAAIHQTGALKDALETWLVLKGEPDVEIGTRVRLLH